MKKRLLCLNLAILLLLTQLSPAALAVSVSLNLSSSSTVSKTFSSQDETDRITVNAPTSGWYSMSIETSTSSGDLILYDAEGSQIGFGTRGLYDYQVDAYLEAGTYTMEHMWGQGSRYTLTGTRMLTNTLSIGGTASYRGDAAAYSYVVFTPAESGYYEFTCSDEDFSGIYNSSYEWITSSKAASLTGGQSYYLRFWNYEDYSGSVSVKKIQPAVLTAGQEKKLTVTYNENVTSTLHVAAFTPENTGIYQVFMCFDYSESGTPAYSPPEGMQGFEFSLAVESSSGERLGEKSWADSFDDWDPVYYQRALNLKLERGKTYYVVMETYYLGLGGTLTVSASPVDAQVPVYSDDEQTVLDNALAEMDLNELLPDISFGMDELKGPQISIGDYVFNLFEIEGKVEIPLSKKLTLQIQANTEKKTVNILVGYKTKNGEMTVVGDPNSGEEDTDYWESYLKAKELYQMISGGSANSAAFRSKFQDQYDKLQEFDMDMIVQAKARVGGFIEFSYETGKMEFSEGGGFLAVELSKTLNGRLPSFPAAYLTLRFKASAEGKLIVEAEDSGLNTDLQIDAALGAAIGVGLGKNTGVIQAYLEGGFDGELGVAIRPWRVPGYDEEEPLTVDLTGSLYFKIKLLMWEQTFEEELFKLGLYPELELLADQPWDAITMEQLLNEVRPISRDYLDNLSVQAAPDGEHIYYAEDIYPYAEPSLTALSDDNMLMVWVGDTGEKADNDRTSIMYSVYNGEGWSSAKVICENQAYNDQPVLCRGDDGTIHLVWVRSDVPAQSGWTAADMLEHLELCYTSYHEDTDTWSDPQVVSGENALAEQAQVIAAGDGEVAVAWIQNSENDLLMNTGTNTVCLRRCTNGTWGEIQTIYTSTDPITAITLSVADGSWQGTCTVSEGDTTTVYQLSETGTSLMEQGLLAVRQTDGHIYYIRDTQLYEDNIPTGLSGISNYEIVSSGTRKAVLTLVPTGLTCELFASYYDSGSGTWGNWVQLTGYGKYVRSYSASLDEQGRLTAALNLVEVDEKAESIYGTASLVVAADPQYTDLVMEDWVSYDDDLVTPGGSLPLSFQVTNNSDQLLTELPVKISDSQGQTLQNQTLSCSIAPGESAVLSVDYVLPQELEEHTVTVSVGPVLQETDTSNNAASVVVGCADLNLEVGEPLIQGGQVFLPVTVANTGYAAGTDPVLTVYQDNRAGETLTCIQLDDMQPGETEELLIPLPDRYLFLDDPTVMYALQLELTSAAQERVLTNNSDRVAFGSLLPWQAVGKLDDTGMLTVDLTLEEGAPAGQFVLAIYDDGGRMTVVCSEELSGGASVQLSADLSALSGPVTAKVFWLNPETKEPYSPCWTRTFG